MKLSEQILRSILSNTHLDHKKENILAKCPFCGGDEWGISLKDNHPWQCFRKKHCGETGGIFKLLKKLGRLDLLGGQQPQTLKYDARLENIIERKIEKENIDLSLETIQPPIGFKRIKSNFYLENRGFDSFDKYEVGTTKLDYKLRDHVITLIRQRGEIKGYIARFAKSKQEHKEIEEKLGRKIPRYRNSTTDFTRLLVGEDEISERTQTVILVEGFFGKENVDRLLGLDNQEEVKCCSTSGAKVSNEQVFKLQLMGIKNIILFFDIDVINKIKKHSMDLLNEFESVKIAFFNDKSKDPADLNEEEMWSVFDNLTDPINFYFNKVHINRLK